MKQKPKVVLTGASGRISSLILPALREAYDLVLLDVKETDPDGNTVEGIETVDLRQRDRDAYRHFFRGADAVIHNGFQRRTESEEVFDAEMGNIRMAYNIYQVAWEEKVGRVVMTCSNHAADYWEDLILDGKMDLVTPSMQARSVAYYGWAKETYEHLGFVFALGTMHGGRLLENVQIRIGGPRETDLERLKRLLDDGALTQDEYDSEKAKILND